MAPTENRSNGTGIESLFAALPPDAICDCGARSMDDCAKCSTPEAQEIREGLAFEIEQLKEEGWPRG